MKKPGYALTTFVVIGIFLFAASCSAFASFDAIVPSVIEIESSNHSGTLFSYWGWIVATTEEIPLIDFQNASFAISINDPFVSVSGHSFQSDFLPVITPLSPGEVAGISNPENPAYGAYQPLLNQGESFKLPTYYSTFWDTKFTYPEGHSGSSTLTASVIIGDDWVNYTTQVTFTDNGSSNILITEGQRLPSTVVPEPVSSILFLSGGAVLALRRFWKKREIQIANY